MKLIILPLLLAIIGTSFAESGEDTVTVTLYYESYCPDCIQYIENKLYSAWTSFKGHDVLFDLVPFGNARQQFVDGHWEFHCQHGPKECVANKLHACAVYQQCSDKGTLDCDVTKLGPVMDFIYCLLRKPDQLRATKACAKDAGLDGDTILSCEAGTLGDSLLNLYGNRTVNFKPKIQYVPTVAINGAPLTVSLYYESYCPGCKRIFENHVYSAWNLFKGQVLFDLLPFGNADQSYVDGHWKFRCQHGPRECLGNKLHACAAYHACGDTGTRGCDVNKLGHVMDFIKCLFSQPDQSKATPQCAKDAGLDSGSITNCANGDRGVTLLNLYGNRTTSFKLHYTPTVAIDGKHNPHAEIDLVGEICKLRPNLGPCNW